MGVFSRYHRYREAGERANVNNVARFGDPAVSLFTSSQVLSLRHRIEITDGEGRVRYTAVSKAVSLRDKTDVTDAAGAPVAHIERKVWTLREIHYITMADGKQFIMSNQLFHLVKDITDIEGLGWQLRGNIAGLNFEIYDAFGAPVAVIGQKMMSLHDKYCIDIYRPEFEREIVAVLVTLQHMICDRAGAAASA